MAKANEEQDHVDRFLAERHLPGVDLEVEAIVDRISGLNRRLHRMLDETLSELGLSLGEWKVLNHLESAGPPYRRAPGKLGAPAAPSGGGVTEPPARPPTAGGGGPPPRSPRPPRG